MSDRRVMRATLASQLEDAIRLEIIEGVLSPGQRLRANQLTTRYGVSATPLREAMQRLAADNLVEIDPRLGATVAGISRSDLRDIYWLRALLEGLTLERSINNADDAWRERVTAAWERYQVVSTTATADSARTLLEWSTAHRAFHDALFSACDSAWLMRFVGILYDHSERYRMLAVRSRLRDTVESHGEIYGAAMAGDTKAAIAWVRRHLSATTAQLEGMVPMDAGDEGSAQGAPLADQLAPIDGG